MHFVDPGHSFGIEPHEERVELGLDTVREPGVAEIAPPTFAYNDTFDMRVFGRKVDFVIGRSVLTHTA